MMIRKYGWKKDPQDKRDKRFRYRRVILPKSISLREHCSTVEDQGSMGSCTGNAGVGALELLMNKKSGKYTDLSRLFAYWNARAVIGQTNIDSGAYIRDIIKTLAKFGVCTEKLWKYLKDNLLRKPTKRCYKEAKSRIINLYERASTVQAIQAALASGFPIIFGIYLYSSFQRVDKKGIVRNPRWYESFLGGHAMLIIGYKKIGKTWYFEVRNSWGENWGDKGYCWIPFKYVKRKGDDFWVIHK